MPGTLRPMTLCVVFGLAGLAVCLPSAWAGRVGVLRHSSSARRAPRTRGPAARSPQRSIIRRVSC